MDDTAMMREALKLAQEAADDGEVPVGCVVAMEDGRVVGRGRNRREKGKSALAHAELEAIGEACRTLGGWRLWQCTLYVTLEPCCMCAGAITGAQIPRVVYGAADSKMGAGGSLVNLLCLPGCFRPDVTTGVLEEECRALLQTFFRSLRERKKQQLREPTRGEDFEYRPGKCPRRRGTFFRPAGHKAALNRGHTAPTVRGSGHRSNRR